MTHALLLIATAAAAAACAPGGAPEEKAMPTSIAPRDPDIAVHEELDMARRKGTIAAYDLFLARHPDHALAQVARREREALARRQGPAR
jgi:hypothetical protein